MEGKKKEPCKKILADIGKLYAQARRMESRAYVVLAISIIILLVNAFLAIKKLML